MKFRLSTRLILSVVIIEVIMLTVLVWNSVRLIGSSHAEVLEEHFEEELKLLANKRDVPYQSLLKIFLAERIEKELGVH